jgi:hypothetical protein
VADRQNLSADDPVNRRNPATSTKSKSKFTEQRLLYRWHGGIRAWSSSAGGFGCDGQGQKTPRNSSTCVVRIGPWQLLDQVEKISPYGRLHNLN